MKSLLTTLAFLILIQTRARSELAKALGGWKVEEDKTPFVANQFIGGFAVEQHFYKNCEERKQCPDMVHNFSSEDKTLVFSTDKDGKDDESRVLADLRAKYTCALSTDKAVTTN